MITMWANTFPSLGIHMNPFLNPFLQVKNHLKQVYIFLPIKGFLFEIFHFHHSYLMTYSKTCIKTGWWKLVMETRGNSGDGNSAEDNRYFAYTNVQQTLHLAQVLQKWTLNWTASLWAEWVRVSSGKWVNRQFDYIIKRCFPVAYRRACWASQAETDRWLQVSWYKHQCYYAKYTWSKKYEENSSFLNDLREL